MSSERMRKLVSDKVGAWDQFKVALSPGDVSEKNRRLEQIAQDKVREEERQKHLEALARGNG